MKQRILVVDDEPDAIELLEFNLKNAGYETATARDGAEAIRKARSVSPNLVLLDLMLPEVDGIQVCKLLRGDPLTRGIPIIMLTAKAAEIDRVLGLEMGANDYITKPYSPRELLLRIRNVLQQPHDRGTNEPEHYQIGPLSMDVARFRVAVNKKRIDLTATEFKLLRLLIERRGRVQSREQLLQDVWEYENMIDTRTVDTHMRRLREKLGGAADYLETVRGVGYRFLES